MAIRQAGQIQLKYQMPGRPLAFQSQHAGADLLIQVIVGLLPHQFLGLIAGNQKDIAGQMGKPLRLLRNKVQIAITAR